MKLNAPGASVSISRLRAAIARFQSLLLRFARNLAEIRRRRQIRDVSFYANLKGYCTEHNVPFFCEDDWRTGHR